MVEIKFEIKEHIGVIAEGSKVYLLSVTASVDLIPEFP